MVNHPNRSRRVKSPAANPRPADIRATRERLGLTVAQASAIVFATPRAWSAWEYGERPMHASMWRDFRRESGLL